MCVIGSWPGPVVNTCHCFGKGNTSHSQHLHCCGRTPKESRHAQNQVSTRAAKSQISIRQRGPEEKKKKVFLNGSFADLV